MSDRSSAPVTLPRKPLCVNRVDELALLREWQAMAAAAGSPFLLALFGPQGIGKSTLGVTLGYLFAKDYPDGLLYCDVQGADRGATVSADDLAVRLLWQLGVVGDDIPAQPRDRLDTLRRALAGKRVLIVFDDVDSANQVEGLLGDVSHAAVIVTSRKRLKELELAQYRPVKLDGFTEPAAIELVTTLMGPAAASIPRGVLVKLSALSGGLPLTLAVSAGRLSDGDDPPEDFIDLLEAGRALDELEVDGNYVVKAVFDSTYRLLDDDEARAYRWLGLMPGPHFGVAVAAAVLELPERDTKRLLLRLVRKYVVQDLGGGRFRYHHFVREHAAGNARELDSSQDVRAAVRRANRWTARRAIALDRSLSRRPDPRGYEDLYGEIEPAYTGESAAEAASEEFDREWPNFLAAARSSADQGEVRLAVVLPMALWSFGYRSGRFAGVSDAYVRALDFAEDAPTRWQLYRDLGGLHENLAEYGQAEEYFRLAAAAGYAPGIASAFEWLGLASEGQGRLREALGSFAESLQAVPLMGNSAQEQRATALLHMHGGRVLLKLESLEDAELEVRLAYEYFSQHHRDEHNVALCCDLLGDIARHQQNVPAARSWWEQAVEVLERHRANGKAADVLDKLADLAADEGREADVAVLRVRAVELRARREND